MAAFFQCVDLHRSFGGVAAVNGVSFSVDQGERVGVIGPNGAGKSTLLNALMGQPVPSSGSVVLDGVDITFMPPHRRAGLGIAKSFQSVSLLGDLTVIDNAVLAVSGHRASKYGVIRPIRRDKKLMDEAWNLVEHAGLSHGASYLRVSELSYGEQRRLDLALTLAGTPRLYLLDEPSAGLTSQESLEIVGIVGRFDRSSTVILIDHDMDVVFGIADRIIVLNRGEILADGTADEVKRDPRVQAVYFGSAETHA
jgi:branched-chain amino acid transport system ATP-binding protein